LGLDEEKVEELLQVLSKHTSISANKIDKNYESSASNKQTTVDLPKKNSLNNTKNDFKNTDQKYQNNFPAKTIMHDVQAPVQTVVEQKVEEKISVGPIEQLQQFTLLDLRRLASDEEKASEILWNKFEVLRQESYMWFLKAVKAWQTSPIMGDYEQTLIDAINKKMRLNDLLGQDKNQMNQNEFLAIASLNKKLNV
ncbi:MAG: hypothetical protein WA057_00765, partial [Candidatus Magasanikiibacteriota bacterium]